jgi:hypothetical protein
MLVDGRYRAVIASPLACRNRAPGQQLVLAQVLRVDHERADNPAGHVRVVSPERGHQLVHGAARAGAAAEQQDLPGVEGSRRMLLREVD